MRLTFLSHEFPPIGGGASTALDFFTRALVGRGHEVQVLTIGLGHDTEAGTDEYGRQIVRMGAYRKSLLAPTVGELIRSYIALRFASGIHAEAFKPDVLCAFFAFPAGRSAVRLGKILRRPVVVSLRGSDVPGFSKKRWGFMHLFHPLLVRRVWRDADVIFANGAYLADLAEKFYSRRSVLNICNGVDCDLFFPEKAALSGLGLNILFVGQLIERKRCIEMLHGIRWAAEQGLRAQVTIIGDGPLRPVIEQISKTLPSSVTVHVSGAQERALLPAIYRKHDILIHLSEAEGVSNVILEAMASGVTVLAIDTAFNRTENTPVFMIPDRAEETVGNALLDLMNDRNRLRTTGEASRRYAESHSWDQVAERYEECIKSL